MASVLDYDALESVTAKVQFTADDGVTPVTTVKEPGAGEDQRTGSHDLRDVDIYDGRPVAGQLDLDR
jgi:hypothetical protein